MRANFETADGAPYTPTPEAAQLSNQNIALDDTSHCRRSLLIQIPRNQNNQHFEKASNCTCLQHPNERRYWKRGFSGNRGDMAHVDEARTWAVQNLNVLLMKNGLPSATYECLYDGSTKGDGIFTYHVACGDMVVSASGNSKKNARSNAALLMMYHIKQTERTNEESEPRVWWADMPINVLQSICYRVDLPYPEYETVDQSGPIHCPTFVTKCIVAEFSRRGEGRSKKLSKYTAARNMLLLLSEAREDVRASLAELEASQRTANQPQTPHLHTRITNARNSHIARPSGDPPADHSNSQGTPDVPQTIKNETTIETANETTIETANEIIEESVNSTTDKEERPRMSIQKELEDPPPQQLVWPPNSILCQRRYLSKKLNNLSTEMVNWNSPKSDEFVCHIYSELKAILVLLDVVPEQMIQRTHDGKFMMALYLSTDPIIADVAVDMHENDLKILMYHRVVKRLLKMVSA